MKRPPSVKKRLKALKTACNMAHKQYKEAHAAVERAERAGQESEDALAAMHAKVEKLKAKADHCRDALDALVEQASKADILAHTGKDLKTLKLDAARAESALRDKADELGAAPRHLGRGHPGNPEFGTWTLCKNTRN